MDKETFIRTEKLYHYTSFQSALKILASNKLLFGHQKNLNDIYESYRPIFFEKDIDNLDDVLKELSRYKQISLTHDKKGNGYAISPMWGHYAEKGNGICLVFDKEKLLLESTKMDCGIVNYYDNYDNSIIIKDTNIQSFFKKNVNTLFFTKKKEWEYEQEFRIVSRTLKKLPLRDSLMAVIMCYADDVDHGDCIFKSLNYNIIKKIANVPILELGAFWGEINLKDKNNSDWSKNELIA